MPGNGGVSSDTAGTCARSYDRARSGNHPKENHMQARQFFSTLGLLAVVAGAAACDTKPQDPPPATTPAMSSDELDRLVTTRINGDPALAPYNLDVDADADRNAVTISGDVPTQGLRTKAVDAAKGAHAGLVVTDKIDVEPGIVDRAVFDEDMAREARARAASRTETVGETVEDAWIHAKIRTKLMGEGEFPGGSLNVDVENQVVTLRGSVTTSADKAKAEQIAKSTDGVKSVRNQVVVKPGA
jgi:osmotically-inducible protein OsmY